MLDRWQATLGRFGVDERRARRPFDDLVARHDEPQRRYHTLDHVEAVLDIVDDLVTNEIVEVPSAVRLAGWFHDAIYVPTRGDNEHRSAELTQRVLGGLKLPRPIVAETARLVELTAGHEVEPWDRNGAVLIDADLAILGAERTTYDAYTAAIRAEYAHVDDETFRSGRRRILEQFLARPRLFHTATAHAHFDATARANLERELDQLR